MRENQRGLRHELLMPKRTMDEYSPETREFNRTSLQMVSGVGMALCAVLVLLCLPGIGVLHMGHAYLLLLGIFVAVRLGNRYLLPSRPGLILPTFYLLLVLALGAAIAMGTVWDPDNNATTFLVLILALPMFALDYPWRINLAVAGACGTFCLLAAQFKEPDVLALDWSNALAVSAISMLLVCVNAHEHVHRFAILRAEKNAAAEKDAFINALPTGIGIFEVRDGKINQTFMNDGFYRLVEDTRKARIARTGGNFMNSIYPEDWAEMQAEMARLIRGETDYIEVNCRSYRGDGSLMWVQFVSVAAKREPGFVLVYTSYSSMENEMAARARQEEHYNRQLELMSTVSDADLIVKVQYDLTREEMVQYETQRSDAVEMKPGDNLEQVLEKLENLQIDEKKRHVFSEFLNHDTLLREYAEGKTEKSIPYRRQGPDGRLLYALLKSLLLEDPKTGDVMLFVYSYDDTRRQTKQNILNRLGVSAYEAIGVVDTRTGAYQVENRSPSMARFIPMQGGDYYALSLELVQSTVVTEEQEEMRAKLKMKHLKEELENKRLYEFPYSTIDFGRGSSRRKMQFQYLDEDCRAMLFTISDITQVYRQEQEQLRRTRSALEEARQATRAKTEFLSRMSHDIRTPLNAILGTANLAQDETDDPAAMQQALDTIESSGTFLLGLINDILDINKIESGKIDLRPEVVSVAEYVSGVEAAIRPLMDKRKIEFTFKMECGQENIYVDRLRHWQIFFNLLSNAAKYTPEGGHVLYATSRIPAPMGMVGIRNVVQDDGIGMTAEYQKHLFEPFTRDTNAAINQTEGSGLGLAIVKSIVDAMGGTITVESAPGQGSRFTVDLFLPEVPKAAAAPTLPAEQDLTRLADKNILLVEDNDINVRIAKKLLEKKGCAVTVVRNGKEAVELFDASFDGAFAMVLMDIRMPVMNGLDATKAIRALNKADAKSIPIIAMTADAFSEDIGRTRDAGMNGHIPKPVDPARLYSVMLQNM